MEAGYNDEEGGEGANFASSSSNEGKRASGVTSGKGEWLALGLGEGLKLLKLLGLAEGDVERVFKGCTDKYFARGDGVGL